jgi:hypothetical protein
VLEPLFQEFILQGEFPHQSLQFLYPVLESAKDDRQAQMTKAKAEFERCQLERQRVLTQVRKGWVTDADAELQFRAVREEEQHWQTELDNLTALADNTDSIWESFWTQLKATDRMFDYGFVLSPERKKGLLGLLLKQFVLCKVIPHRRALTLRAAKGLCPFGIPESSNPVPRAQGVIGNKDGKI